MGILNLTPDSFFDGGKHNALDRIETTVRQMINNGLDILDLGAMSSRPGSEIIEEKEEWRRLAPYLSLIKKQFPNLIISIDTFRSSIAEKAIDHGAHIINDISGGNLDEHMYKTVARLKVPYILMHMKGTPDIMQVNPSYENVVAEVLEELGKKKEMLTDLGIDDVIIDPGFGFGKNLKHNYTLLRQLSDFEIIEAPILVGISRKRMINEVLGTKPAEALNGTTALNAWALQNGADILRVHDIKEAKQVVTLHEQLKNA